MATYNAIGGLFEDPQAARQRYEENLFVSPQAMGQQSLLNQLISVAGNSGAMAGMAGGRLLGGQLPEERKAMEIEEINKIAQEQPDEAGYYGVLIAGLRDKGYLKEAMSLTDRFKAAQQEKAKEDLKQKILNAHPSMDQDELMRAVAQVDPMKAIEMQQSGKKPEILQLLNERKKYAEGTPEYNALTSMMDKLTYISSESKAPTSRKYEKGAETIWEEWDNATKTWKELGRAPTSSAGNQTAMIANLEWQAKNILNCDLKDKACYERAAANVVAINRADQASIYDYRKTRDGLEKGLETARADKVTLQNINRSLKLLEKEPIVGLFSDIRTNFAKLANLFNLDSTKKAALTEALNANNAARAGQILASGIFGAGTGISDRDLESAAKMAGASGELTAEGMMMILQNLYETVSEKLKIHNKDIDNLSDSAFRAYGRDRYRVEIPEIYARPTPPPKGPTIKLKKDPKDMTIEELQEAHRQFKGK